MKECYIRQEYDFGQRVEYDFGEVKLIIDGKLQTCHMAVFCAPASGFRWLYLYTNQKKGVFHDSHVRFFEKMGGVFREVVYDNMKNVVHKFLGKNEKELDKDLVTKLLENFDRTKYDSSFELIFDELETLRFITNRENIILIGTPLQPRFSAFRGRFSHHNH